MRARANVIRSPRMSRAIAIIVLGLVLPSPGRAEVIEIPLPGLLGEYPAVRTVTFQLPGLPDAIHGAAFCIAGAAQVGVADCGIPGEANLWPLVFTARMQDTPNQDWEATHEPKYLTGLFTWTADFGATTDSTTWDFLMDGEAEIGLTGVPLEDLNSCTPVLVPYGEVTEAVLILDVEFLLAVESTTWGRVKQLYRR